MPKAGYFNDLTGQRFGRLTVISFHDVQIVQHTSRINRYSMWECQCDCGNTCVVKGDYLKSGRTKSCGCLLEETRHEVRKTHNQSKTRLYRVYNGIKNRCYNKNEPSYPHYGGRGIKICDEWTSDFTTFREWAITHGYDESLPSSQCTIERIDVNGDYSPENCRWASLREQGWNKRNTHYVEYGGKRVSVAEASELSGVNAKTIYTRLSRGHDPFVAQRKSPTKKASNTCQTSSCR
jgi:hypothetical protein